MMKLLRRSALFATITLLLAGCYTGHMQLEQRYIQDYKVNLVEENGKQYLRITGRCGLPGMAVSQITRSVDKGVVKLQVIVSENARGDNFIDEQLPLPSYVDRVQLGGNVIWQRSAVQRQPANHWPQF